MEEITIEEAMKRFGKNAKVLVATQNLESPEQDVPFVLTIRNEFDALFSDVKTVSRKCDDFINKYDLFTAKQDIFNVQPIGKRKTVLLKE